MKVAAEEPTLSDLEAICLASVILGVVCLCVYVTQGRAGWSASSAAATWRNALLND
jgi:hypothetical protein